MTGAQVTDDKGDGETVEPLLLRHVNWEPPLAAPLPRTNIALTSEHKNVLRRALDYERKDERMISRLQSLGGAYDSALISRCIAKLWHCSDRENVFLAVNFYDRATGELFNAVGRYAPCSLRLCAYCNAKRWRRAYRSAFSRIIDYRPSAGEHWQLITLTMPLVSWPTLRYAEEAVKRTWTRLLKKTYFTGRIGGGVRRIEFSWGANDPHLHLHALVCGRALNKERLRTDWSDCIEKAWRCVGRTSDFCTSANSANIDVKVLRLNRDELEIALRKCCRYLTKPEPWDDLPNKYLLEILEARRLPRQFDSFGVLRCLARSSVRNGVVKRETRRQQQQPHRKRRPATSAATDHASRDDKGLMAAQFKRRRLACKAAMAKAQPYADINSLAAALGERRRTVLSANPEEFKAATRIVRSPLPADVRHIVTASAVTAASASRDDMVPPTGSLSVHLCRSASES